MGKSKLWVQEISTPMAHTSALACAMDTTISLKLKAIVLGRLQVVLTCERYYGGRAVKSGKSTTRKRKFFTQVPRVVRIHQPQIGVPERGTILLLQFEE